ncbi:MAG: hypothetical protein ABFR97_07630 [Thermodesulfobacteriota bacterium]
MSEENEFVPYEVATKIIANIVEEENIHDNDKRVLTVYDHDGEQLCWYDADEVEAEVIDQVENKKDRDAVKCACVESIMHQIPKWAVEDLLKRKEKEGEGCGPGDKCGCSVD